MRRRGPVLAALAALAACDLDGGRVARLEQEVQALRAAAQPAAMLDASEALAPLRAAIDGAAQRVEIERARSTAMAAELSKLASLVQGFVDDGRRAEVEALRGRVGELERQIAEQGKSAGEERALMLQALELTATKLEAFLRQAGAVKAAPADPSTPSVRRSWQDPAVLWALGLGLAGVVGVYLLSRRGPRAPRAVPLDLPLVPDVVVDAPEPMAAAAATVPLHARGPTPVRVELAGSDLGRARERVAQWLIGEPRVLTLPAPEFEQRGPMLQVRFFVQDGMSAAERASLAADVMLRGQAESPAESRRA